MIATIAFSASERSDYISSLMDRFGYIERNGRRYSVLALAALRCALEGDVERIYTNKNAAVRRKKRNQGK